MLKYHLLLIGVAALFLSSCKLDEQISPNNSTPDPTLESYQPVTKGSFWKYLVTTDTAVDTSTTTITGSGSTIDGEAYFTALSKSRTSGTATSYYHTANHKYAIRGTTIMAGLTAELYYLNDTIKIGHTWVSAITSNGMVKGIPCRIVGQVVEKGLNKILGSNLFTNVIHTQLFLQYNTGSGYQSAMVYDYYIAKGVGIIKVETSVGGVVIGSSNILSYSIK